MASFEIRRVLRLRWFLYGALILYFGVQALQKWWGTGHAPAAVEAEPLGPGGIKPSRYEVLPDGSRIPVFEITPEEAERHFGVKPKPAAADDAGAQNTALRTESAGERKANPELKPEAQPVVPAAGTQPSDAAVPDQIDPSAKQ
jgi:hypothetical protein